MFFVSFLISGCNKYIAVNSDDSVYYGVFNRRDMIHADVKLYKQDLSVNCDGMIFLNSPSRAITMKNDTVDAKLILGCSDKRLINADLKMTKGGFTNPYGVGVDQLNNKYNFTTISKNEFQKNIKITKHNIINDKGQSLLKY